MELDFPQIKYHEDFEKMKGKKASVVDDPELMRIKQNTAIQSNIEYHRTRDQLADMEQRRPAHEQTGTQAAKFHFSRGVLICSGKKNMSI